MEGEALVVEDIGEGLGESNINIIKVDLDENFLSAGDNQEPEFTATVYPDPDGPQYQVIYEGVPEPTAAPVTMVTGGQMLVGGEVLKDVGCEQQQPQAVGSRDFIVQQCQVNSGFITKDQKGAEFRSNACEQMYIMQQSGVLCDLQFDVAWSEAPISLHSVVLAGACRKFREELFACVGNEGETSVSSIAVLGNLSQHMMNQMVRFLYTGEIALSDCEDLDRLLECSQQLQLGELEQKIGAYLKPTEAEEADPSPSEIDDFEEVATEEKTPTKKRQGRPPKRIKPTAAHGGSPLQKDNVDSTTNQERSGKVASKVTSSNIRKNAKAAQKVSNKNTKEVAAGSREFVSQGQVVEDGGPPTADDMIVSSTDDKDVLGSKVSGDSYSEEEVKVSSSREGKQGKGKVRVRKQQEIGASAGGSMEVVVKRGPGRPKKDGGGRGRSSQENLDSSVDDTKSGGQKKMKKSRGAQDTSLVMETAPTQDTSLITMGAGEDGEDVVPEELRASKDAKSVSSSRRTIKRPSWFNKDFITANSMDNMDKGLEVAKKPKLSFNPFANAAAFSSSPNKLKSSPSGKFSNKSPVREVSTAGLPNKLFSSSATKTPAATTKKQLFSVEHSEFLKGLGGSGTKMRREKDRMPGWRQRKKDIGLLTAATTSNMLSGRKPKTIFIGDGRKRRREPSVEIEYVIVNKFRSHNWKHYRAVIAGHPSVDLYDMATHPVLKAAVTGYTKSVTIEGDLSGLITIPPKEVKNAKKKPRSRKVRKVKEGQQGSVAEEIGSANKTKADVSNGDKASPRGRGRPKKVPANQTTGKLNTEEGKDKVTNNDAKDYISMETGGAKSADTDALEDEVVDEEEESDEEEGKASDEEITITEPVKRKRGRPRALHHKSRNKKVGVAAAVKKSKGLWKPKKTTFASQFSRKTTSKQQLEKIREIRESRPDDALEVGLCLILEMNYSMPRAAHAAGVESRDLRDYVRQRQKEGALKRVVVRPRGNTGQQFYCMCGESFRSINAVNGHVDKYECKFGREIFKKCGKCKLPYWDDESYLDHFDKEHPTSKVLLRCNYCPNYEVRTCRLIQLHMKLYHGISLTDFGKQTIFSCKYKSCDYETFYETCVNLHHKEHAVNSFRCFKCSEKFRTYSDLQEHRRTNHRDTTYSKCNLCELKFEDIGEFKDHMLVYHEDSLVPGYTKAKSSYFEEDDTENTEEVYGCELCDFSTNSRNKLTAHTVAVHPKGNRDSVCPDNQGTYEPVGTLPQSARQLGPKLQLAAFECDICEGFRGTSAVTLAVHKFREHGEDFDAKKYQLFACSHCQFTSTNQSVYKSHLDSHVGLSVKCRSCIRHFYTWEEMEGHAVIHQKGRRLRCDFINCEFSCSIQGNLRRHMARHQSQGCEVKAEDLGEGEVDLQMAMAVLGASSQSLKPRVRPQPIRRHVSPKKRFSQVKRRGGGGVQVSLLREKARALVAGAKQRSPVKSTLLLDNNPWQTISMLTEPQEVPFSRPHGSSLVPTATPSSSSGGVGFLEIKEDPEEEAVDVIQAPPSNPDGFIIQNIMDLNQDIVDLGGSFVSVDPTETGFQLGEEGEFGGGSSFVVQHPPGDIGTSMGDILGGEVGVGTEEGTIMTLTPEQMSSMTITTLDYSINEDGELIVINQ